MRRINRKLNIFIAVAVILVTYSGSGGSTLFAKEHKLAHNAPPA